MGKKVIAIVMAVFMMSVPMASSAAAAAVHDHIYDRNANYYLYTVQDGTYTHQYITGYLPGSTTVTYGTCTVICEIEYYGHKCTTSGCYAWVDAEPRYTYTHGKCGN